MQACTGASFSEQAVLHVAVNVPVEGAGTLTADCQTPRVTVGRNDAPGAKAPSPPGRGVDVDRALLRVADGTGRTLMSGASLDDVAPLPSQGQGATERWLVASIPRPRVTVVVDRPRTARSPCQRRRAGRRGRHRPPLRT